MVLYLDLLCLFNFRHHLKSEYVVSVSGVTKVCLHYRRGDFLVNKNQQLGYTVPSLDFVNKSFALYRSWYQQVKFVVVSDDIIWCQQNIRDSKVVFSQFNDSNLDFALLTTCDHVIVTSGTFGWWGAWLSGGRTVYFAGFPRENSWLDNGLNRSDYYPSHWIGLK